MKLSEQDLRNACDFIMHEACKIAYGDDYKEKNLGFSLRRMPITVREIVDLFIEWLKKKITDEKTNQKIIEQTGKEKTT
jgi:hypothetical protein